MMIIMIIKMEIMKDKDIGNMSQVIMLMVAMVTSLNMMIRK